MIEKKYISLHLEKAKEYELLAQFYKYSSPDLHIHYYLKHLNHMNKAIEIMRQYPKTLNHPFSEAKIRIIHVSPNCPKIDIYVNNSIASKDLAYKKATDYVLLPAGENRIELYPAGQKNNPFLSKKVQVESGKLYTLAIIGRLNTLKIIPYLNQPRVPSGEAKVRYLHLSPNTPSLDIAVKERDVIFPELSYEKCTEYLGLSPMIIDLEVRVASSNKIILPMPMSHFLPNEVYTMVLIDSKENKGIEVLQLKD